MIDNKVKLVVWDLDETFWRGTLSEEGIVAVDRNIEIVAALPKRGILNSICSKNDPEQTKAKLVELGVWDWFVFPSISFNPKGKAVAEMIEGAALRPENVLFIDDNRSNLEEVKYFNPGIMACHPDEVLEGLLDHPNLAGKPDPELTRLKQYKFLQRKVEERGASDLSNEEFLRASNIRVTIDYEIEANFDRIVELVNRANQLNYTKLRLDTAEAVEEFREKLSGFGFHAGCVHAADRYGDYGLIGFFMLKRRAHKKKLVHFVFSCRTMNMGIEQYVYESLDRPDIDIVQPVSYGLESHAAIDWINTGGGEDDDAARDRKLVLVGGCHLLQLASYCSTNRSEFVNVIEDGDMVRFDDPGFIMSDRAVLKQSEALRRMPSWQYEDAARFDEAAARADLVLIAMWPAMNASFLKIEGGIGMCLKDKRVRKLENANPKWFKRNIEEVTLDIRGKLALVAASFDALAAKTPPGSHIFVLSCYTRDEPDHKWHAPERKHAFNDACRAYCEVNAAKFRYIELDTAIPPGCLVGKEHFSRAGYFALARYILDLAAAGVEPAPAAS
jgi:FkbH-like protein